MLPQASPPPAGDAIIVPVENDDGNEEEGALLPPPPPLAATSSAAMQGSPQQIRWDRIVTAGLGVMALVSLLFVATDSAFLFSFTPRPTNGGVSRVPARDVTGPSGDGGSKYRFSPLSYKDEASPGNRRRQPLPPCNYTLLSADPEGVTWAPDAHGVMAPVSHAGCRLRAFEEAEGHAEALRCLRGKHLLFIGDSLSRYQYLSLVHFLNAGTWHEGETGSSAATRGDKHQEQQQQQEEEDGASRLSVTFKDGWGSFNDFYRRTSQSFGGREVCDCNRNGHAPWVENRYYSLPLPRSASSSPASSKAMEEGGDTSSPATRTQGGGDRVRVSFLGWFGGAGPRGHAFSRNGGLDNLTQEALGCEAGECRAPHDWEDTTAGFLRGVLIREQLRPDIVLLNTGLWKPLEAGPQLDSVVQAAQGLHEHSAVDVYWKTTTSRAIGAAWVNDTAPREAFLRAGLKVFDASLFTLPLRDHPELYRDVITHYTTEVYRGLNRLLLNEICP